jgi:hypothetical protein
MDAGRADFACRLDEAEPESRGGLNADFRVLGEDTQ